MSQDYTPVAWVDETTSQQGTLINAARLNQMQTAHHYADGFEEVDAIPAEDPGVDYHKVVYCTADATFYRWDGTQWTADIDEETKHLLDQEIARAEHAEGLIQGYLDAHEANHANPHAVTKAQVGLGNCDNTADLDKPISTATQAALDTKADKATTLAGYGITDAVATSGAQTVGGVKTFTDNPLVSNGEPGIIIKNTDVSASDTPASTEGATIHFAGSDGEDLARIRMTKGSSGMTILRAFLHGPHADTEVRLISDTLGSYMIGPARAYDPANTSDIMTIGVYKAQTDTLLATKADTTALTDGSVTKVGTADLGTDTKPIKLVAGVPTAVGHDLVTIDTEQTITAVKTHTALIKFQSAYWRGINAVSPDGSKDNSVLATYQQNDGTYRAFFGQSGAQIQAIDATEVRCTHTLNASSNSACIATLGYIDGYGPMVRTTGNQDIAGAKTFKYTIYNTENNAEGMELRREDWSVVNTPSVDITKALLFRGKIGNSWDSNAIGEIRTTRTNGGNSNIAITTKNYWNSAIHTASLRIFANNVSGTETHYMTGPYRAYNANNPGDVATIGTLDGYSPMVRTSGNQVISGLKRFENLFYVHARVQSTNALELARYAISEDMIFALSIFTRFGSVEGVLTITTNGTDTINNMTLAKTVVASSSILASTLYAYIDNGYVVICFGNDITANNYFSILVRGNFSGAGIESYPDTSATYTLRNVSNAKKVVILS